MFSFNEYIIFILSYLLGSVPFGLIIVKLKGLGNISQQGSGNIGATNVVRVAGKKLGAITFLLDFLKGFIPVDIYQYFYPENYLVISIIALLSVVGHIFTPWLKFKGGKGVATGIGVIFAINYLVGLLCIITWLACFKASKISSASALLSFGLMPFYFFFTGENYIIITFGAILSILVFAKHHSNIKKLLNGEESSFRGK